jgi:hypothetical protein
MKGFASVLTSLCFAGGLASAATFTGRLMDADCYNTDKVASQENGHKTYQSPITKTCAATASTSNFAVRITDSANGGRVGSTVKLDDSGNTQAASEMQSGALKAARDGAVHVRISGKLLGETFETASVRSTRRHQGGAVESSSGSAATNSGAVVPNSESLGK